MDALTHDDVRRVARSCRAALSPLAEDTWNAPARDLEWSCKQTLAHILSALLHYSINLATRSEGEPRPSGQADPTLPLEQLLDALEGRAAVLAELCANAPAGARGAHQFGRTDVAGFLAMGCDEMLIHTDDIAAALGATLDPPREVCARVLARLFPWAPRETEPWETLRWANGRAQLGDRPRLHPDWVWHSAPLAEWDGTDPNAAAR